MKTVRVLLVLACLAGFAGCVAADLDALNPGNEQSVKNEGPGDVTAPTNQQGLQNVQTFGDSSPYMWLFLTLMSLSTLGCATLVALAIINKLHASEPKNGH